MEFGRREIRLELSLGAAKAVNAPVGSRNFPLRACALGCGLASLLCAAGVALLLVKACPGDVAQWTGSSEGRVVVRPGMTRAEVEHAATVQLSEYGDSGRYVEFELTSDAIALPGMQTFRLETREDGKVSYVDLFSANETWSELRRRAMATEEQLLARGWKAAPGQPSIRTLPASPKAAAGGVTESGAIAHGQFIYSKGEEVFKLEAGGLWSGIPWWQPASRAQSFWRNMSYFPLGDPFAVPPSDPPRE